MIPIAKNIDWTTVDHFARVSPEVRWAHLDWAYRVWVEKTHPFDRSGWWAFDTIEEFSEFQRRWPSIPNDFSTPGPGTSSSS